MYWILGRKSGLALANILLLFKTILKPIWTYGITLWGTVCYSNSEILQRFQNKVLRTLDNAPWYIPNSLLHTDLQMSTVRDEIMKFSTNYRAKLVTHPNALTSILLVEPGPRRLKRFRPTDLPTRFS
jgi:carbonic anhydrase